MKNKGFTLVELLAVIALLSIIATTATAVVITVLNNSKEKLYDRQIDIVIKAAKDWAVKYDYKIPETEEGIEVSIQELYNEGFLESATLKDPRHQNQYLCGPVTIINEFDEIAEKNKYEYKYNPTSSETCQE